MPLSQLVQMGFPAGTLEDYFGSGPGFSTVEQDLRSPGGESMIFAGVRDADAG